MAGSCASSDPVVESRPEQAIEVTDSLNSGPRVRDAPTLRDHWHVAFGVYDCRNSAFLAPFLSEYDPDGIHSHQDGVIHIHPFTAAVTGTEARLDVFLTNMGASLTDSEMIMPGGETVGEGVDCGGEPAVLQVVRWADAFDNGTPSEVITDDLGQTRFLEDGEGIVIALAPEGANVPPAASVDHLAALFGQDRRDGVESPNTSSVPGPQDFGTETTSD